MPLIGLAPDRSIRYIVGVMPRAIARLRLLLPEVSSGALSLRGSRHNGAVAAAVDVVARALADALAGTGITTRQQLQGAGADGAPRADLAIWFPGADGKTIAPDPRAAPARVHVAVVVDPTSSPRHLQRYDALLVPAARHVPLVVDALRTASRRPPVLHARLAGVAPAREAERVERQLTGPVVVLDMRDGSAAVDDVDRVLLQLALRSKDSELVLATGDDGDNNDGGDSKGLQKRLRTLADRHSVGAWLTAGDDGLTSAITLADYALLQPRWGDVLVAALTRTPIALLPSTHTPTALASALRSDGVVDDVPGILQLAATIDRRLQDPGALRARGLALHEQLFQPAKALYDQLADLEPLPGTLSSSSKWEAIGPRATTHDETVRAVDPASTPPTSAAQKIEDDLAALKARLQQEQPPAPTPPKTTSTDGDKGPQHD